MKWIFVCVCLWVCTYACVSAGVDLCGGQRTTSAVVLHVCLTFSHFQFFVHGLSHWLGSCKVGEALWPMRHGDPMLSTRRVLGLQACVMKLDVPYGFLGWNLGLHSFMKNTSLIELYLTSSLIILG